MNKPNQPTPTRYDAPAVFGPSLMPDRSACEDCENWTISFETTRDAAARLLPRFFELDERAFVSVHRITYRGVDYLAGGEYRELAIGVDAVYNGPQETIKAAFTPVLWVDQVSALVSGRELLGSPKVYGRFPDAQFPPGGATFEAYEYDGRAINALLMRGEFRNLSTLPAKALADVNARVKAMGVHTFGWKIIPSTEGAPDLDYPTLQLTRWQFDEARIGEGRISFLTPGPGEAPISARIMRVLADLPIKEYRKGLVARGAAVIERQMTRHLPLPERMATGRNL